MILLLVKISCQNRNYFKAEGELRCVLANISSGNNQSRCCGSGEQTSQVLVAVNSQLFMSDKTGGNGEVFSP